MRKEFCRKHISSFSPCPSKKQFINVCLSFLLSTLGSPYTAAELESQGVSHEVFEKFLNLWRGKINNTQTLLGLLVVRIYDSKETVACKLVFKEMIQLFLRHFSLDWILKNDKTGNKMRFLRYRSKLIKKLQKPYL